MFIYNLKINRSKVFKYFFTIMIIILIVVVVSVIYKMFTGASKTNKNSTCIPTNEVCKINSGNYTNILKVVHDDVDKYIGTKINFTGYVYRVLDLSDNQFILARDMIVSSDYKKVVVGFLCEYDKAKDYSDNSWVEITGEIIKGTYHGDMPIVKITNIDITNKPNDEYVYPPDDNYISTDSLF